MGYKTRIRETFANLSRTLMDRGGPDPRTLLKACVGAMEQGRKNLLEKTYVPNFYRVYLRGKDIADMGPLLESIRRELTAHLAGEIRRRKYATTTAGIVVDIVEYSELGPRAYKVEALFTEDESPAATDANSGTAPIDAGPPPEASAPEAATAAPEQPAPEQHGGAGVAPTRPAAELPPTKPLTQARDTGGQQDGAEGATRMMDEATVVFEVTDGSDAGRVIKLGTGRHAFGRGQDADVRFADPEEFLSRVHARVEVTASGATIVDDGSANGVFVNDARVEERALAPGDTVRLGNLTLKYHGSIGAGPTL